VVGAHLVGRVVRVAVECADVLADWVVLRVAGLGGGAEVRVGRGGERALRLRGV